MNYPFRNAIREFVANEKIKASEFLEKLDFLRGRLNNKVIPVLLNLIDSHDTPRFLHICNENKHKQKLAAAFQLLLPGMPMIYYGDEFAMTGAHDPDCRRGMLWKEELQDKDMFKWYKTLIKIRKTYPCITEGKTVYSFTDDENGIIILTKELDGKKITLIFHGKSDETSVSGFTGTNLLTQKTFDGKLGSFETVVLE
jgi:glycosidase